MPDETIHESRRTRSRRAIATYMRRVADALGRGEPVPADDEETVLVDPPTDPEFEVAVERDGDELSLGLEVVWSAAEGDVNVDVESRATFEIYVDRAEQWRWRLVHDNGNIIADSAEGYASKQKAEQGLESVRANAPDAGVVSDADPEGTETPDGTASRATFEVYEDNERKWRWRLVHDNGNIVADGGQGYASKQKAKQGLRSVKANVPGASIEELD